MFNLQQQLFCPFVFSRNTFFHIQPSQSNIWIIHLESLCLCPPAESWCPFFICIEGFNYRFTAKCEANTNCHNAPIDSYSMCVWVILKCIVEITGQWINLLWGTMDCSLRRVIITSERTQRKNTKYTGWKEKKVIGEIRFGINEERASTFLGDGNICSCSFHTFCPLSLC